MRQSIFCVMSQSVCLWLCLSLPLLFTDAKSVGQHGNQHEDVGKTSSGVKLEEDGPDQSLLMDLDLDRNRRLARGADEDEQQSTFSHSFENDWVTAPQVTEFSNRTQVTAGDNGHDNDVNLHVSNASIPEHNDPGLFNPFYPLAESSYAAYAILFLAGLVLAVGVVGNMAVMCVVWNNYYMRSAWNYLLASMAFWDFLVLVLCLPVVVLNQLSHRRILGDITCRMVPYMEVGGASDEVRGSLGVYAHI